MDIAQKTKAADSNKNGFLIRGGSADNILSDFLPHLVVHGGWVVDENNNPTVDTPEFKAAMQEYLDLYALGSTLDKDDIVASVTSGETALAQIWPGWYTPTADGPANYTTIPTKLTDDSAPVDAVALQGVWCIGIPDNAPHKDLALELLEYVMSPEVQLASIENNGVPWPVQLPDRFHRAGDLSPPADRLRRSGDRRVPPCDRGVDGVHQHPGHRDGQHHPGHQDHGRGAGLRPGAAGAADGLNPASLKQK